MTLPRPPTLDSRRSSDFESELVARARDWIALWGLADGEPDFGQALLQISARFNSEVAERLDLVGDKAARGFLDWLAIRGEAARPARMPIAFKLAETAHEPVQAPYPVKMQVDVADATVTFETETDICVVPGRLDLIVGVDPSNDAVFLPPPGLSNLDPLEPAPTQWRLKDFAAPASTRLQFDPGAGLDEGMLVEIAGAQYTIREPKGDLATIDPPVPAGEGFAGGTLVTKVDAFHPFDGARNRQNHILYLGDAELLNVEAPALIDVIGAKTLGTVATWEYWGKIVSAPNPLPGDDEPQWRALTLQPADVNKPGALVLSKPKGSIEPVKVGDTESRWIRARTPHLTGDVPLLTGDGITLRINAAPGVKPAISNIDPNTHPPAEAIVNTTPAPASRFYLLGREPRLFDTLYIGCAEAFSKPGATAWVQFDLAASVFSSLSALNAGPIGFVLAGVDTSGALQLFRINPDGTLVRLAGREPMTPGQDVTLNADIIPVMWLDGTALSVASVGKDNKVYVWQEVWPFPFLSRWYDLGSPTKRTAADSPVLGLVLIHDTAANNRKLVALRDKRLSMRTATVATSAWVDVVVKKPVNTVLDIEGIAQIRHQNSMLDADKLLAVSGSAAQTLYSVDVNVTLADELLSGIAPDVHPFGIQRNSGVVEAVAVKSTHDKLLAAQGTTLTSQVALDADVTISNATLGGRVEGGQFAAYAIANATAGGQALVAWLPFAAGMGDTVFRDAPDATVGALRGGLTIVDPPGSASLAILPGNNKGEIFAAELGGSRPSRNASQTDFLSSLAVAQPFPAINVGDTVAPDVAGQPEPAVILADPADGKSEYANRRFFLLKPWLDRNTDTASIPVFMTSAAAASGQVTRVTTVAPFRLQFPATVANLPTWILVDDGAGVRKIVKVLSYNNTTHVADVDILAPQVATPVDYWVPSSTIQGSIFPALQLNSTNNDWTADALDRGGVYFSAPIKPARQRAIATFADALKHPQWIAFESAWINPPVGITTFVVDGQITKWAALFGDSSANPALTWEYWNGSGWRWLNVDDETSNFRNGGLVIFTVPSDLKPVDWAGKTNHWIRARLVGGDYGREKVVVKTKTNPDGTTEQTIDRTTEGIQPPFAIDFQVSYSIDTAVAPSFLLTEDSLTLRDQSDANRTSGAQIDVFTPLIYTLSHFERDASKPTNASIDCVPDCDCPSGSASASPAKKPPAPPPAAPAKSSDDCDCTSGTGDSASASDSRSGSRALYLGLSSKLIGEPINVLLAAQEQNNDVLAPLTVEALIGHRFVPVVAKDGTRALGESGVVSMSFSVEPVPMELFGETLSWLRLTPSGTGVEWNPVLLGAYLNAVWARSAETMTRELVGSSEGAPDLTLQLARPPLLHDSLELRVKEPLGIEERKQLLQSGLDTVKSDVQDLPGDWVLWTQVNDPHDHEGTDRVYALDEDTGTIQFGDGRHGAIPPIGVDAIVAFQYERTDPSTGGEVPANQVSPRTALNLVTPIESVEAAIAAGQSAGGLAPESADRVVKFGASKLRHRGRAVTARDFEDIALENFAGVVQARCFVRAGKIQLVVVMRGPDPMPSRAERRELRAVLLAASSAAVSATGVLTINGPAIRRLRIDLVLRVSTLDLAGAVGSKVKAKLKSYFDTETGGENREGWPLGSNLNEDDIAEALLDTPDLESIASIALFEVGSDGTAQPWPASIRASELVMLADDIRIQFQIVEAVE